MKDGLKKRNAASHHWKLQWKTNTARPAVSFGIGWCWKLSSTWRREANPVTVTLLNQCDWAARTWWTDGSSRQPSSGAAGSFCRALHQKDERGFRKRSIWRPRFAKTVARESPTKVQKCHKKKKSLRICADWVDHLEIHLLSAGAISPCKDPVVDCREEGKGKRGGQRQHVFSEIAEQGEESAARTEGGRLGVVCTKRRSFSLKTLKCGVSRAMSAPWTPWPLCEVWLIQRQHGAQRLGAASHTPRCKIMSLQQDGIKYMGRGRHLQSLSPSWIFKWNEEGGRRCDLLVLPQKERDKEIHFPLYVHAFTCHPPALTIRRGGDPFAYGFYEYEDLYLFLSGLQSGPSTDKPYWSYGNSNTAGVSANSDGLIKLAEASYIIE